MSADCLLPPAQAFRPCPSLVESGGTYNKCVARRGDAPSLALRCHQRFSCSVAVQPALTRRCHRKGQDLDEVMFGKNR